MINIGIIGVGLVGSELFSQILKSSYKNILRVVALSSSEKMLLSDSEYKPLVVDLSKDIRSYVIQQGVPVNIDEFENYLVNSKQHSVIIDCTASENIAQLYPSWLRSGLSVVTPNKKGFAGSIDLFKEIRELAVNTNKEINNTNAPLVYHETTVGAGLPILSTLADLIQTGDDIIRIEGIFSGCLSYVFNTFCSLTNNTTQTFSEVVYCAKKLGYTEPDPRDDLNGMDAARKASFVIICGRLANVDLELSTLSIDNIMPQGLQSLPTSEEFMRKLPEYDDYFSNLRQEVLDNNQVLRYIGIVDFKGGESGVQLIKCPASHPFASLKGGDNIIRFTTKRFPNGFTIQGDGGGAAVTAYGIFTDLIKIQERVNKF
ncbi:hypothetical protein G6F66_003787 [Rhizopus arrhizus]|uniref:Homoserine dehydrogenase n=1 Tax=Rhizopus oryzae TaxID=64495 RepID=A0A9P7BRQ0_RHIOR|nr:hypothetical protein G6F66_003787 [Rhizopus arrhizus]KAG1306886.1 hypothetical protein G6F64_007246 [Rhizopus arrhizus]